MLVLNDARLAVYRLSDGTRLARLRDTVIHLESVMIGPKGMLLRIHTNQGRKTLWVRPGSIAQQREDNLLGAQPESVMGDVLITKAKGRGLRYQARVALAGYSLAESDPRCDRPAGRGQGACDCRALPRAARGLRGLGPD